VVDPDDVPSSNAAERAVSPPQATELARRFADAGLLCILAFESPLESERHAVRDAVGAERFFEIYVATPLEVCRLRDQSGSYQRTHAAALYEAPRQPALTVSSEQQAADEVAGAVLGLLERHGFA
jgi:adenylylsulfate kinase-like enzyme